MKAPTLAFSTFIGIACALLILEVLPGAHGYLDAKLAIGLGAIAGAALGWLLLKMKSTRHTKVDGR